MSAVKHPGVAGQRVGHLLRVSGRWPAGLIILHLSAGAGSSGSTCRSGVLAAVMFIAVPARGRGAQASAASTSPAPCCSRMSVAALMVAFTELGTANHAGPSRLGAVFVVSFALLFVLAGAPGGRPDAGDSQLWSRRPIATANAATLLRRHDDHRADHLPADVCAGRAGPLAFGGRLRADHDGAGLADRRHRLGPQLRPHRVARHACCSGAALLPVGDAGVPVPGAPAMSPVIGRSSARPIVGLGMGFLSTVGDGDHPEHASAGPSAAAATASNVFSRNLGSTLGAAILGGVLNFSLARQGNVHRLRLASAGCWTISADWATPSVRAGLSQDRCM